MTLNEYTVEEINNVYKIVKEKRFLMLKGATGTGKTLYAHALACLLVGCSEKDIFGEKRSYHGGDKTPYDSVYHNVEIHEKYNKYLGKGRIRNVIFHKATSRENFVYGISVSTKEKQLQFESRKRVFLETVEAANGDKDHAYVIILDDIGRADFSAVMGDLLSALESMGDGNTFQADEKHEIPQNLYIIATYNPAVAASTVDYAWYRRFFVYELNPDERYIIKSKDTIWKNNSMFALYDEKNEMRKDFNEFSNFRNMDDYQRFMDYVYVLFLHVKILFEKYSTDPDVRNLYIPGHGMFLTYVEGKSSEENSVNFKKNIDTFHFQLHHVIVPLLYHCLHTGLLDQRAAFDIDLLDHLWEEGYGEIEPILPAKIDKSGKGEKRCYEDKTINGLTEKQNFPVPISYFFFLRNPLLMRIDQSTPNLYFLFEKEGEHHCDIRPPKKENSTKKKGSKENYHRSDKNNISIESSLPKRALRTYDTLGADKIIKTGEKDKEEDYKEKKGQVYSPQCFLKIFKTAIRLLEIRAIVLDKEPGQIWGRELEGKLRKYIDKPGHKSGRDRIIILYKALGLVFPNSFKN